MIGGRAWQDWANLILGIWLFLVPLLGGDALHAAAAWNCYVAGTLVIVFSGLALYSQQLWEEWVMLGIAVWLPFAPLSLHFMGGVLMWNCIIVGTLLGMVSLLAMLAPRMGSRPPRFVYRA